MENYEKSCIFLLYPPSESRVRAQTRLEWDLRRFGATFQSPAAVHDLYGRHDTGIIQGPMHTLELYWEDTDISFYLALDTGSTDIWLYGTGYCELLGFDPITHEPRYAPRPARGEPKYGLSARDTLDMGCDVEDSNNLPKADDVNVLHSADGADIVTVIRNESAPILLRRPSTRSYYDDEDRYTDLFNIPLSVAVAAPRQTTLWWHDGDVGVGIPTRSSPERPSFICTIQAQMSPHDSPFRCYIRIVAGSRRVLNTYDFFAVNKWPCPNHPEFSAPIYIVPHLRSNANTKYRSWLACLISIHFVYAAHREKIGNTVLGTPLVFNGEDGIEVSIDSGSCHTWLPGAVDYVKETVLNQSTGLDTPAAHITKAHLARNSHPPGALIKLDVVFTFRGMDGKPVEVVAEAESFLTGRHSLRAVSPPEGIHAIPEGSRECLLKDPARDVPPGVEAWPVLGLLIFLEKEIKAYRFSFCVTMKPAHMSPTAASHSRSAMINTYYLLPRGAIHAEKIGASYKVTEAIRAKWVGASIPVPATWWRWIPARVIPDFLEARKSLTAAACQNMNEIGSPGRATTRGKMTD
ncbi:hypothetical protein EVG20_g10482 [Dentipellis fragilis]|uniref:Uncharacterized protein n=1 Tax=Dentipellis fragilis TaxID=205917 RepID=A0A4Y9XR65_9AGAM|nr:hypothetical protein EVG20_g10482 [Dentipellis fragilis]